jgi:hypothetical protein
MTDLVPASQGPFTGKPLITINNSQLKAWRRCQRMWMYKYDEGIVPKKRARPLFLGSWVHACLESHYRDGDWKLGHQLYLTEWNKLFDEEKEELSKRSGPLPQLVERIMRSYLWYTRNDGWKVHAVEQIFSVEFKGILFKGRIDLIIEDEDGKLWVVDHKTASTIPESTAFHAMDPQLILYPWAAEKMWGLDIAGVIYNYVKSKAPSVPKLNKDGSLSRRKIVTDYPTVYLFLKRNGYDPRQFWETLKPLQKRSPFLRRYRLPREDTVLRHVLREAVITSREIRDHRYITRNITRDCARGCGYHDLCRAELNGFDTSIMRRTNFVEEEPLVDYAAADGEPDEADAYEEA